MRGPGALFPTQRAVEPCREMQGEWWSPVPPRAPLMLRLTLQSPGHAPLCANLHLGFGTPPCGTNKGRLLPGLLCFLPLAWDDARPNIFAAGRWNEAWIRRGTCRETCPRHNTHHFAAGEWGQMHFQDGRDKAASRGDCFSTGVGGTDFPHHLSGASAPQPRFTWGVLHRPRALEHLQDRNHQAGRQG